MSKSKVKTKTWDPAEHLQDEADIAAYLEAAFEELQADLDLWIDFYNND